MKYSKYNHIFTSNIYGHLLYNAETNSFAEIDDNLYQFLQRNRYELEITESIDDNTLETLLNAKIIVEKDNSFLSKRKLLFNIKSFYQNSLNLVIAPTTFCNFNCPYCYEENRSPIFMDDKTIDNLIIFIKKYKQLEQINIEWYGGEPLAGFEIIKKIIDIIGQNPDIKIGNHSIVTNGYLLTEDKSIYFSDHPLNAIQITIDGNEYTHNSRRKLKNGKGSYDTIIKNIDIFLKYNPDTHINIRVNIDASNKEEFIDVYNSLHTRWQNYNISFFPAFIDDFSDGCTTNCLIVDKDTIVKFYLELYQKYDFPMNYYPNLTTGGCTATTLNSYVIGPEGELYKCWCDIGLKDKIVGYLNDNKILNENILYDYLVGYSMFDDTKCQSCEIFPICDGGCQWKRIQNNKNHKNYNLCSVRKNYLDRFLETHYTMRLNSETKRTDE